MTKLAPSGMFATPYGIEVPIHRPPGVSLPAGEHAFSAEAVAFVAGIMDRLEAELIAARAADDLAARARRLLNAYTAPGAMPVIGPHEVVQG